jgi:hyaluronoglucosaminidase
MTDCIQAEQRFEKFGFHFFEETLKTAKRLRPAAKWGYYAFPYCFNFTPKNPAMQCTTNVQEDNDRCVNFN